MSYDVNFGVCDCVYNDEPCFSFLDYMSDEEIDDYYNSLEAELNELSKFL